MFRFPCRDIKVIHRVTRGKLNKDKIIKYGNELKKSVSIIIKNNISIINYISDKNIKITRLIDYNTFTKNNKYEQINNDFINYNKVEKMLNSNNINSNICYINNIVEDICKDNKKYLVTSSVTLNKFNLSNIKDNIKNGYIIDDVSISDFKLLLKQIYYQDLKIVYLSELISEKRS